MNSLLPQVLDLLDTSLRPDAISLLSTMLALPGAREQCSDFGGLLRALLQALPGCDARGAVVILGALEQLQPEVPRAL